MLQRLRERWRKLRADMALGWDVFQHPDSFRLALAVAGEMRTPLMDAVRYSVGKVNRDAGLNKNAHSLRYEEGLEWARHWCDEKGVHFERNKAAMLLEILVAQNHGRLPR